MIFTSSPVGSCCCSSLRSKFSCLKGLLWPFQIKFNDRWLSGQDNLLWLFIFVAFERSSWKHDRKAAFRLPPNPLSPIRQTQFNGVSRTFDTESSPQSIDFQRQTNSDWAQRRASARAFFCVVLLDSKPFPMIKLGSGEWTTCVEIVCCWVYARLDTCLNLLLFNVCLNEIVHLNEHEIPKRNPLCSQADFTELTCGWMGGAVLFPLSLALNDKHPENMRFFSVARFARSRPSCKLTRK